MGYLHGEYCPVCGDPLAVFGNKPFCYRCGKTRLSTDESQPTEKKP